jgi:hypothetical protein
MIAAQDALEEILEVGRPEPEAVGDAYAKIFDIQRRMIVERVRNANEIAAVLDTGDTQSAQAPVEESPADEAQAPHAPAADSAAHTAP